MEGITVRVESYSGYREAERPSAFYLHGEKVAVLGILRSWVEEDQRERRRLRCFLVSGDDRGTHTLCHDEVSGEWLYIPSSGGAT